MTDAADVPILRAGVSLDVTERLCHSSGFGVVLVEGFARGRWWARRSETDPLAAQKLIHLKA